MPFIEGFNFRALLAFVTDGADEQFVDFITDYPTTAGGVTFGWTVRPENSADRNAAIDRRLAGINYQTNDGTQGIFRVDLPAPGNYQISLALGDDGSTQGYQYAQILDNTTPVLTVNDSNGNSADHRWDDATGTEYTETTWPTSQTPVTCTFATTTLFLKLGTPSAQIDISTLSHLSISAAPGGAGVTPRRGCLTMIADRMAKAVIIASAVHTVVGHRVLRGAAQRTKVAIPIVVDVQIKPPKVTTELLPYLRKGAPVKKPRPFPDTALIRKPLPITKSVVLPHMLKGAPQRKPRLLPEIALVRTPFARASVFVGDHFFPIAVAAPRIIVDPTTTSARTQLPRVRSVVARASIQHPTSGSGAPIVSMIEMDPPIARSFIGHRATLPPTPPAPSRARAILALFRTQRPVVETAVGSPLPRIVVAVPANSRARPLVVRVRTPRPITDSTVGTPLSRFAAATPATSRPDPVTAVVRTPLARIRSFIGLRPKSVPPAAPRPRPRLTFVRITPPKVSTDAGSGIARGPTGIQLAIRRRAFTVRLTPSRSGTLVLKPLNTILRMSLLNGSISSVVAGDDLDIIETVLQIPAGQTLVMAWLTFKADPSVADPGLLQKVITLLATVGQGQITDDGADGTGMLLFQLSGTNTLALPVGKKTPYEIKVKTSAGKIYTAEQGNYFANRRLTQATS